MDATPLEASQNPENESPTLDAADVAIGQRVAALRERAKQSEMMLAALAGIALPTVKRIEAGHGTTLGTLRSVAKALGVPMSALVDP